MITNNISVGDGIDWNGLTVSYTDSTSYTENTLSGHPYNIYSNLYMPIESRVESLEQRVERIERIFDNATDSILKNVISFLEDVKEKQSLDMIDGFLDSFKINNT